MMQTLTLYCLYKNSDQTEGCGHNIPVAYFTSKSEAEKTKSDPVFYKKYGVFGCDNCSMEELTFLIYDTKEEFVKFHAENAAKQRALDKLTEEDKKVLGLL